MSEGNETSRIKLILECVALMVTIAGTAFGAWTALRQTPPDATSQHLTGPAEPSAIDAAASSPVTLANRQTAPTVSNVVRPASFVTGPSPATRDRFATLLRQYPVALLASQGKIVGFDEGTLSVDVGLSVDQVRAAQFHAILVKTLSELGTIASTARIEDGPQSQHWSLDGIGNPKLIERLQATLNENERTDLLVSITPPAGGRFTADSECELAAWPVDRAISEQLAETFKRCDGLAIGIEVLAGQAVIARKTINGSFPERPTRWSADRYVTPLMPMGAEWSLSKALLAPEPALSDAHRESANTRRVMGFSPCFLTTIDRPASKRSKNVLTPTVTYHTELSIGKEMAEQPLSVRTTIQLPD